MFKIRMIMFIILSGALLMTQSVMATGGTISEDFSSNPTTHGWSYNGASPSLFSWDSVAGKLNCTWDTSTSLSRFNKGINFGFNIDENHSFNLQFDISFSTFSVGAYANYPLAIGLYNSSLSGNRQNSILEWDYYLGTDSTFGGPNFVGVSVIDQNYNYSNCSGAYSNLPGYTLQTSITYHVNISYNGSTKTLNVSMTANGNPFGTFNSYSLCGMNFSFDQLGVINYFDDTPVGFGGPANFRANGMVDNIQISYPASVEPSHWMRLE